MPRIEFVHPEGVSGEVEMNLTILEAAQQLGFPLNHECGGNATCVTCRVEVKEGVDNLDEIDFDEQDLLDREEIGEPWRLGCQARLLGDVKVRAPGPTETPLSQAPPEERA
ncbi:MAG TPA: (2Fe-2S)-binding protein [Nitrospirales bacterium]|nr:(2Fe-2S)-binding protein [Nitrospirales bacterium]